MPIYIGNSQIGKVYIGNQKIGKVYVGSQLVYSDSGKCIDNGSLVDDSPFSGILYAKTINIEPYTSNAPIFGVYSIGDSASSEQQDLVVDAYLTLSSGYRGDRCTIKYQSFFSARGSNEVSAYIKDGNNLIGNEVYFLDDPDTETPETYTKTFTISDGELHLHIEYHGTSWSWSPSVWIGIREMIIGEE